MPKRRSRKKILKLDNSLENLSDNEILEYLFNPKRLTTPFIIDANVNKFCKQISPDEKPIFLDLQPQPWSRLDYCNKNVEKMIQIYGGKMVLGYKIWYIKSLYIEAERHSVWKNLENKLVDITFNKSGEERILFLPNPNLKTVVAEGFTKPRMAFTSRVEKAIRTQIEMEKMMIGITDDTWTGWDNAISFEKWKIK